MSSLTISARNVEKEGDQIGHAVFTEPISETFLSNLLLCTKEQLEQIAQSGKLETVILAKGAEHKQITHYRIDDIPAIVRGLQTLESSRAPGIIRLDEQAAVDQWRTALLAADTNQSSFTLVRPSGSTITFQR